MGIKGLNNFINKNIKNETLLELNNITIAIDGDSWVYYIWENISTKDKSIFGGCYKEILDFLNNQIDYFEKNNIKIIVAFDGSNPIEKAATMKKRKKNKNNIIGELYSFCCDGKNKPKYLPLPKLSFKVIIQELKKRNIKCFGCPSEVDNVINTISDNYIGKDTDLAIMKGKYYSWNQLKFENNKIYGFPITPEWLMDKLSLSTRDDLIKFCFLLGNDFNSGINKNISQLKNIFKTYNFTESKELEFCFQFYNNGLNIEHPKQSLWNLLIGPHIQNEILNSKNKTSKYKNSIFNIFFNKYENLTLNKPDDIRNYAINELIKEKIISEKDKELFYNKTENIEFKTPIDFKYLDIAYLYQRKCQEFICLWELQNGKNVPYLNFNNLFDTDLFVSNVMKIENNKLKYLVKKDEVVKDIHYKKEEILQKIKDNNITCIFGNTGCGKSSLIPQFLFDENDESRIIITQPRRSAVLNLAKYVSTQISDPKLVGYRVMNDRNDTQYTKITYVTTGYFVEMLTHYPSSLDKFTHIILDEIHERDIYTDLSMTLVKQFKNKKIILMSATLDYYSLKNYFELNENNIVNIFVKSYPVSIKYIFDSKNKNKSKINTKFIKSLIQKYGKVGDTTLIFLDGIHNINILYDSLYNLRDCSIHILHSLIPKEEQQKVFHNNCIKTKKIVIATNIAESSITLPKLSVVIDTGICKLFEAGKLKTSWISKASAIQRAGRVGRTMPGIVIRTYTEKKYDHFLTFNKSEILTTKPCELILKIKKINNDICIKKWLSNVIEPPSDERLQEGIETLYNHKILNGKLSTSQFTKYGELISKIPTTINISRFLIECYKEDCLEIGIICSVIIDMVRTPFLVAHPMVENDVFKFQKLYVNITRNKLRFYEDTNSDIFAIAKIYYEWRKLNKADKKEYLTNNSLSWLQMNNFCKNVSRLSSYFINEDFENENLYWLRNYIEPVSKELPQWDKVTKILKYIYKENIIDVKIKSKNSIYNQLNIKTKKNIKTDIHECIKYFKELLNDDNINYVEDNIIETTHTNIILLKSLGDTPRGITINDENNTKVFIQWGGKLNVNNYIISHNSPLCYLQLHNNNAIVYCDNINNYIKNCTCIIK